MKQTVNKESLKSFQVIKLSLLLHMQSQIQSGHFFYLLRFYKNTIFPRTIAIPRLIASLWRKYLKWLPSLNNAPCPPSCHFLFLLSPPCWVKNSHLGYQAKLKWRLMQQNWSVMIRALKSRILTSKINQGAKFETHIKSMYSILSLDVIIFFYLMGW